MSDYIIVVRINKTLSDCRHGSISSVAQIMNIQMNIHRLSARTLKPNEVFADFHATSFAVHITKKLRELETSSSLEAEKNACKQRP